VKLFLRLVISVSIGVICLWLALRNVNVPEVWTALRTLPMAAIVIYALTLMVTHLFRAWRWQYLLRPIGVTLPFKRLLTISSVGFMAILALPVRLGEFIRPYYVVRGGQSRMSAVLGTVAVERIVDGLLISILFFVTSLGSNYEPRLQLAAQLSLGAFVSLTLFLAFALHWTERTIRLTLAMTLLSTFAPHLADRIADKLRALIRGFRILHEPRNLFPFLVQTVLYWGSNGLGMWLLARSMNLDVSLTAVFAAMALTGLAISLPNPPGNIGPFHLAIKWGLGAYGVAKVPAVAYATALHGIQFIWYVGVGVLCFGLMRDRTGSLREAVVQSNRAAADGGAGVT
jgi:glycosyltransferase 2 family protein